MPGAGIVNQAQIDASQIGFQTLFAMALEGTEDPVRQVAMEIISNSNREDYDWLDSVPGLSEWLDDRKLSELKADGFSITNRDWASGVRINANDVADDKLGLVRPKIQMLGVKAGLHYGQLIGDYLAAGDGTTLGTAYDGQAFFSTTHPSGPGGANQSNKSTAALANASYDAARAAMRSLTDVNGDPLNIEPTHLLVGPSLERTALEVTQAGVISDGTTSVTNVFAGTARVIVSPKFVGANASDWVLLALGQPFRPIILQIREAISTSFVFGQESSGGAQSYQRFMQNKMFFGAQGRHAVGYGLWQFAHGSFP